MQKNLSQGTIGRVMVDRNTVFHFLDISGLKRNRQIRMIRNIDFRSREPGNTTSNGVTE